MEIEFIIQKVHGHEIEVTTLFDFIMYYVKLWKLEIQKTIRSFCLEDLYDWVSTIEGIAYDLSKSVLIDLECL